VSIILASASPRRRELMSLITEDFEIICSHEPEKILPGASPEDTVTALALQKASAVKRLAASSPDSVIIGADTVVAVDGVMLGKPGSREDAARMLRLLSGREHSVFTGVAIIAGNSSVSFFERTEVEFYPLDEPTISAYCQTSEPFDKAGAYGIQGKGALLVKGIRGDYFNVMGLPISRLARMLREFGIDG